MGGIPFVKMHGGGNDFVVIDATERRLPARFGEMARRIADRRLGVGCDQILILHEPREGGAEFDYRIINADGGEVAQCGNGARCVHAFLRRYFQLNQNRLRLRTSKTLIVTEDAEDGDVRAYLGVPKFAPADIPLNKQVPEDALQNRKPIVYPVKISEGGDIVPGKPWALSLGNPHAIFFVTRQRFDNWKNLAEVGNALNGGASHQIFPDGVNVGFCLPSKDKKSAALRVYERGVGITPSCGSAAVAAAVVVISKSVAQEAVRVRMDGGELLCGWGGENSPAWVQGPVAFVFEGTIPL